MPYCPTCAARNIDDAQFCRACGADISFLSEAMKEERQRAEKALRLSFIGASFLLLAIIMLFAAPAPAGWIFCFSMLCAAFPLLGSGLAEMFYMRRYKRAIGSVTGATQTLTGGRAGQLPPRNTSEIIEPSSVTEGTTKALRVPRGHRS